MPVVCIGEKESTLVDSPAITIDTSSSDRLSIKSECDEEPWSELIKSERNDKIARGFNRLLKNALMDYSGRIDSAGLPECMSDFEEFEVKSLFKDFLWQIVKSEDLAHVTELDDGQKKLELNTCFFSKTTNHSRISKWTTHIQENFKVGLIKKRRARFPQYADFLDIASYIHKSD